MLSMHDYLRELKLWKEAIDLKNPDPFFKTTITDTWFRDIAPSRAREYGVECFQRFGPKGVVAQLLNCTCRIQVGLADPVDTMRDAFGYSIMLGVVLGQLPNTLNANLVFKESDVQVLVASIENSGWHADQYTRIPSQGIAVAYSTWQRMKSGALDA